MISTRSSTNYKNANEVELIKEKAAGRWTEILSAVCGFSLDILDGKHHPCPICGGDDRFRLIDADDGAVLCNQCFRDKNGDGIAATMWALRCDFPTALQKIADHLGVTLGKKKRQRTDDEVALLPWSDQVAMLWAIEKPGVQWQSVRLVGGQYAKYRGSFYVIALPVYDFKGREKSDWAVYHCGGLPFTRFGKDGKPAGQVKMKLTSGCQPGILGTVDRIATADEIILTEGPTDLLALLSIAPDACVLSNPFGCGENPGEWVKLLEGKRVVVIRDCDRPGQAGAAKWCAALVGSAREVKNVVLPFEVTQDHGQDLRDWIASKGGTWRELRELIDATEPHTSATFDMPREYNDPERLADGFAAYVATSWAGRRYVIHCGQWYERLPNRYRPVSVDDLKSEVRKFVRLEFQRAASDGEHDGKFAPKVSAYIVNETIAALAATWSIRSDVELNSWINDDGTASRRDMLSMKSCLLDLGALLSGESQPQDCLQPHSPAWFSTIAFDYDFPWACVDNGLPDAASGRQVTAITELPATYLAKVDQGEAKQPRPITEGDLPYLAPTALGVLHTNLEGDQDRINLLQEWTGYSLLPDTNYQKFLMMQGEGANGKSVYCAMLQAILGDVNCSMIPLEVFGERFQLAGTLGKLANICSDAGEIDKAREGMLKAFTSGDRMSFERKYLPSIDAVPTARLVVCCNTMPNLSDRSDGIWRRMMLVPWRYQVPEADQVPGMDKAQWWRDLGELPGMMAWAIFGANRLLLSGRFTKPELSDAAKEEYRTETNSARLFLSEAYQKTESDLVWVAVADVYKAYSQWCTETNHWPFKKNNFTREVCKFFGIDPPSATRDSSGKGIRVFRGITEAGDVDAF